MPHRRKMKTNRLKNKRDQLVDRKKIPSLCRKQITHLQSCNQTYMELRNRTVMLRQQVQHRHHAEIPIQNSQSHNKCTLLWNKSYSTYRLEHPLRKWRHPWKNKKTSEQPGSPSQSTIRATTRTYKHQETKKILAFRLTRHLRWHRWMNTLPRHSNTWYMVSYFV